MISLSMNDILIYLIFPLIVFIVSSILKHFIFDPIDYSIKKIKK